MITIAIATALATAVDQPDPAAFPELSADALAPAIIQDLKRTLPDPYSVRDLTICPAYRLKLKDGRPFSWSISFGLNAKGPNGGYTGLTAYAIGFREGRVTLHAFASTLPGKDGLDGLINNHAISRIMACTPVSDARVQELLTRTTGSGN